jgi:hypothetical protein
MLGRIGPFEVIRLLGQGVPYLVMTYSRGVSLQKRLNDNGPLEIREIFNKLMAKLTSERFDSAIQVAGLPEDSLAHVQQLSSAPLPVSLVQHTQRRRSDFNVTRTENRHKPGTARPEPYSTER